MAALVLRGIIGPHQLSRAATDPRLPPPPRRVDANMSDAECASASVAQPVAWGGADALGIGVAARRAAPAALALLARACAGTERTITSLFAVTGNPRALGRKRWTTRVALFFIYEQSGFECRKNSGISGASGSQVVFWAVSGPFFLLRLKKFGRASVAKSSGLLRLDHR